MPSTSIFALLSCVSLCVPLSVPSKKVSITLPTPAASMPTALPWPDFLSCPSWTPTPSGALLLLMSKKSPLIAATAFLVWLERGAARATVPLST